MIVILGLHWDKRRIANGRVRGRIHLKPGQPSCNWIARVIHILKPKEAGGIERVRQWPACRRERPIEVIRQRRD